MPTYNEELIRDVRRDFANKDRLVRGLSSIGRFALDDDVEAETAKEFAARMLKNIGLPVAADPITALDMYIKGHSGPPVARRAAQDAAGGSFMDKYLSS